MPLKKKPEAGKPHYSVIWDLKAKEGLKDIYLYFKPKSLQGAKNVKNDILATARSLSQFFPKFSFDPDLGYPYRRIVVRHYRIIYLINERKKEVYILDIFDGRQNPQKLVDSIKG